MRKSEAVNNKNKIKFVDWKWWMRCDARTNRMFVNGIKIVRALCEIRWKKIKQEKNKKKCESCVKDGTQAKSAKSNSFREFSFHFFCRRFQLILKYFSKTILPLILATWIATEQWQPDWMKVVKMNEWNDKQKKINQFSSYWKKTKQHENLICPNSSKTRNLSDLFVRIWSKKRGKNESFYLSYWASNCHRSWTIFISIE